MAALARIAFAAALVAVPLWLSVATPARACVFAPSDSPDPLGDNVAKTDVIAIGTIGEMLVLPSGSILHPETLGGLLPLEIKFHVSEYLKGSGDSTLLLYRPTYRVVDDNGQIVQVLPYTDCDYFNPKLGDQYLLFMQKTDPLRYEAGIAQRISPDYDVSGFIADVRAAIVRRAGLPGAGVEPAAQHSSPPPAVLLAFGAGLLASGAFLAVTRRRN